MRCEFVMMTMMMRSICCVMCESISEQALNRVSGSEPNHLKSANTTQERFSWFSHNCQIFINMRGPSIEHNRECNPSVSNKSSRSMNFRSTSGLCQGRPGYVSGRGHHMSEAPENRPPTLDGTIDLIVVESQVRAQQDGDAGHQEQSVSSWHHQQVVKQRSWQQRQMLQKVSSGTGGDGVYISM